VSIALLCLGFRDRCGISEFRHCLPQVHLQLPDRCGHASRIEPAGVETTDECGLPHGQNHDARRSVQQQQPWQQRDAETRRDEIEVISASSLEVAVLEMVECEFRLDVAADSAGACGDVLQGAPAAGQEREAAFTDASSGALQCVVGLVVRGQGLAVAGLFDRGVDAQACAFVSGVGEVGSLSWENAQYSSASAPLSRARLMPWR
jgi:hypothetical protein